jgi:FMN phosphatase YigB (HAD superfamily)
MTLTLLIDLDDTLLGNAMETFIPAYTNALAESMIAHAAPQQLIGQLMRATHKMAQNQDASLTLEEVFDQHFYPALGIQRESVQTTIDEFYAQEFPKLRHWTTFLPEAVKLISQAVHQGTGIAIATNPLFPRTAVLQRLEWAGLPAVQFPFKIIPGYETFHFAKPNLAFFPELLGQLGWMNEPVIMVGNDYEMDIQPAKDYGLATFWITSQGFANGSEFHSRHAQGRLVELLGWINDSKIETFLPTIHSKEALIASLRGASAALDGLTRPLAAPQWKVKPSPEEWSLTEIVCHLRDVEVEINYSRLMRILQGNNPFIAGRNSDLWASERNYQAKNGQEALREFLDFRKKTVHLLENLQPHEWDLKARHAIFGPITLFELVEINASHDRLHLQTASQLAR